jgi:preprotein translocase subunit SecG
MAILVGVFSVFVAIAIGAFWGLTAMAGWTTALAVFFIGTCALLTLVVLIQKPKGGGLAGAFGGAGGGQQAVFGAKAGDMFTLITVCLFLLFLLLGMGLVYSTRIDDDLTNRPNAGTKSTVGGDAQAGDKAKSPASKAGDTADDRFLNQIGVGTDGKAGDATDPKDAGDTSEDKSKGDGGEKKDGDGAAKPVDPAKSDGAVKPATDGASKDDKSGAAKPKGSDR